MFACLCVERCTAVAPRCSSLHKILTIVISVCVGLVLLGALIAFIVVMLRQRAQKKLQSERIKAKILIGTSEAAVLFFYNLRVHTLLVLAMCYVCFAVSLVSRCSRCSIEPMHLYPYMYRVQTYVRSPYIHTSLHSGSRLLLFAPYNIRSTLYNYNT